MKIYGHPQRRNKAVIRIDNSSEAKEINSQVSSGAIWDAVNPPKPHKIISSWFVQREVSSAMRIDKFPTTVTVPKSALAAAVEYHEVAVSTGVKDLPIRPNVAPILYLASDAGVLQATAQTPTSEQVAKDVALTIEHFVATQRQQV